MLVLALIFLVLLVVVGIAAIVLAVVLGRRRFRAQVAREVAQLFANAGPAVGPEDQRARWESFPEPLRRYLRFAISDRAPAIRTARLKHNGFIRPKPEMGWLEIQGEEYFSIGQPGFVWHGEAVQATFLWVEVRDALLAGRGNMCVKLCSTFGMADARGAEIDQAASMRWLAEAMWFPYAMAGSLIRWEAVDAHSARATLLQDGLPVSAVFEVDDEGKLERVSGDRYLDAGEGKPVLTPWFGRCAEWREWGGFQVPTSVEVSWNLATGEFCYVRFNITALEFNVADPY